MYLKHLRGIFLLVCYTAVFCVVTQRWWGGALRDVTTLKTAV